MPVVYTYVPIRSYVHINIYSVYVRKYIRTYVSNARPIRARRNGPVPTQGGQSGALKYRRGSRDGAHG